MRGRGLYARVHNVATVPEHRRALKARVLLRLLRESCPRTAMLAMESPEGLTFLHASDTVITPIFMGYGAFQREELGKAIRWGEELGRSMSGVLVDVGANVGTTTLDGLRWGPFARAVCVEPAPDNLRVLGVNVTVNGLADRCTILPVACSAKLGTATLLVSDHNTGDHRVTTQRSAVPRGHEASIDVETVPLDAVVSRAGVPLDDLSLIWIDTQGHEAQVLQGGAEVFASGVPACLELWPEEHTRIGALDALLDALETRFEAFTDMRSPSLDLREISEVRPLARSLGREQTDLFLVPRRG